MSVKFKETMVAFDTVLTHSSQSPTNLKPGTVLCHLSQTQNLRAIQFLRASKFLRAILNSLIKKKYMGSLNQKLVQLDSDVIDSYNSFPFNLQITDVRNESGFQCYFNTRQVI